MLNRLFAYKSPCAIEMLDLCSRAGFNGKPGCLRFISQLLPSVLLMGVGGVHCCCPPGKSSRWKRSPCPAPRNRLRAGALSPELWQQHGHETDEVNKPTIQAFLYRIGLLFFLTAWLGFWVLILCIVPYLKERESRTRNNTNETAWGLCLPIGYS